MTDVPFDKWARPEVGDLLCFAEGSDRRGSHIADLYALREGSPAARVTIWGADILSLMQSAFEEGWRQGESRGLLRGRESALTWTRRISERH